MVRRGDQEGAGFLLSPVRRGNNGIRAPTHHHTVRLPRRRNAASYSAQFVTRRFGGRMWWGGAVLALGGMGATERGGGPSPYPSAPSSATPPIRETRGRKRERRPQPPPLVRRCGRSSGVRG